MSHEPFVLVPIVTQLAAGLVTDNLAQVLVAGPASDTYTISGISSACRNLTAGTATVVVKNNAGSIITTINLSSGAIVSGALAITTIVGGDRLRMGLTSLGIGLADITVTVWLRMPSVA